MRLSYHEESNRGNEYRLNYLSQVETLCDKRRVEVDELRMAHCADIRREKEKHRKELIELLGWPLTEYKSSIPETKITFVADTDGVLIYRMQFEVMEGLWAYGILFRHKTEEKRPLILSLHGGSGSAELVSGMLETGSANYRGQTERILSLGAHVFAPQLLLWSPKVFGNREDAFNSCDDYRRPLDTKLQLLGGSVTALEITAMRREIDYFVSRPFVDAERIGMVGLSYGGFYTLHTAAVEPRIRAALASCSFTQRYAYSWSDMVWRGAGLRKEDAEVAMLIHPRKLVIQLGEKDPVFAIDKSRSELEKLKLYCGEDTEWLRISQFSGVHEFDPDDTDLVELMKALK